MMTSLICAASAALSAALATGNPQEDASVEVQSKELSPKELGLVKWSRDLDSTLAKASPERPIFLLFQEVPG
jgi:hypothetical protein